MAEKKRSLVALAKEETVQESVSRVFDLMGGVENMIEAGSTVVLKPNAGHAAGPESAVCTSPEVVRAVIREVKKSKAKRIVIAEAAAVGCDTMQCYAMSGIKAVAEEEEIELIDIKSEKDLINVAVRGCRSNISHVKLPRLLLEAEHIINIPVLKAHASMVFSCALKNIKGVVQDNVHLMMHQSNLTMAMMDVWSVVKADINIVDAINVAGGYSPHTPTPKHVGCILGSRDPVAVDLTACDLVGIDTDRVDYFKTAEEVGMGNTDRSLIDVVGADIKDCRSVMWVPYLGDIRTRWPEYDVYCEGACSSCQALLTLSMETLKAIGSYEEHSDTIVVIGGKNKLPSRTEIGNRTVVLCGNCTKKYQKELPDAIWLVGCPPGEAGPYLAIDDQKMCTEIEYARKRMENDQPAWRKYVDERAKEFYAEYEQQ